MSDSGIRALANGAGGAAIYGDGSDGDVTNSSPLTLTRDMFYDTLLNTSTIDTAGFVIFVRNKLTNSGTIRSNGANGGDGSAGVGGTGGLGGGTGSVGGGGNGGNGRGQVGAGFDGDDTAPAFGGDGGKGGDAEGQLGGAAGDASAPAAAKGGFKASPFSAILKEIETTVAKISGGGGGGGGAGKFTPQSGGGGGGGGGGDVVIFAYELDNAGGTIESNGGDGGTTSAVTSSGGGGGGGGGFLVFIYDKASWGTETVTPGIGGLGVSAGDDGANGVAGTILKLSNKV